MVKDKRYNTVKILIETGHVTEFRQIFEHIAKTAVAEHMGIHFQRFNRIIDDVTLLSVKEIYILAGFIGVEGKVFFDLVDNQHKSKKKLPRKKS